MLHDHYAQALMGLMDEGKSEAAIATGLMNVLTARGHRALLPRILRACDALLRVRTTRSKVTLTLAHDSDAAVLKREITEAVDTLGLQKTKPEVRVDERIVGGFILHADDSLYDASHRRALVSMYRAITAHR